MKKAVFKSLEGAQAKKEIIFIDKCANICDGKYRSWTPRMTPRSSATHAPGSGLISTDAPSPKMANFIKYVWHLNG